jgi:hypothetical protein
MEVILQKIFKREIQILAFDLPLSALNLKLPTSFLNEIFYNINILMDSSKNDKNNG